MTCRICGQSVPVVGDKSVKCLCWKCTYRRYRAAMVASRDRVPYPLAMEVWEHDAKIKNIT